jgi:hypothetical protein
VSREKAAAAAAAAAASIRAARDIVIQGVVVIASANL